MKKRTQITLLMACICLLLTSCEKSYVCECEVEYKSGKNGYEYYPMDGSRNAMERKCFKGKVADNVKYDRGDCHLMD